METLRETAGLPADRRLALDGSAGVWSIEAWCRQFGVSEAYYHALDPKPRFVKLSHRKVRITESPAAYAERLRKLQERKTKPKTRKAAPTEAH